MKVVITEKACQTTEVIGVEAKKMKHCTLKAVFVTQIRHISRNFTVHYPQMASKLSLEHSLEHN